MAKYIIDSETLTGIGNAIRNLTGETRTYTPIEMIDAITHIMDSPVYLILDQDGNEHYALYTGEEPVLTATSDDIFAGKIAITGSGVTVGTGTGSSSDVEIYDGSVVVSGGTSLISFTIADLGPYQAEEGMTWGEWVESEYNTDGWYVNSYNNNIVLSNATFGVNDVVSTDVIVGDTAYTYWHEN